MTKEVFDSYRDDGWYIFEMYRAEDGRGNAVKGMYGTPYGWTGKGENPKQYEYKPDAVYGGVPPEHLVVIDWDVKKGKKGLESFNRLQEDLGCRIETVVLSPSGGGHAYARLNGLSDEFPRVKQTQKAYPAIDFQGHGSEFVVLGGQHIDGYGEYSFSDEDFGYFVNENTDFGLLELRPVASEEDTSYDDIDMDEHYMERGEESEFVERVMGISPDTDRDTWVTVLRCINSFYLGDKTGEELAVRWSTSGDTYADEDPDDIRRAYHGNVATTPKFYNKLIGLVNEKDQDTFQSLIQNAKTTEDFEEIAEKVSASKIKNDKRTEVARTIAKREKELGLSRLRNVHWEKSCKYSDPEKAQASAEEMSGLHVYIKQNEFILKNKSLMVVKLTRSGLGTHCRAEGISKEAVDLLIDGATRISDVTKVADYTMDAPVEFRLTPSGQDEVLPILTIASNPLYSLPDRIVDQAIIKDFTQTIWQGKVDDIVDLIGYTIRFKQHKLNRLMVVAPSDFGKSEIFKLMNFQDINMSRLLKGMSGEKGVGEGIIAGIQKSGLLLIDEANTTIPQAIKELDKTVQIDQFGSGGTQIIPLHFTALTSTHKTATRTNSDELRNRFLQVELSRSESPYTLTKSPLFRANGEYYTAVVRSYLRHRFRDALLSPDVDIDELFELQDKYRLPENNDLHELLHESSLSIIEYIKANARETGDIVFRNGEYLIKRKGDLRGFIEDKLTMVENLDVGKYSELIYEHFLPDGTGKSIKVDGTPVKYYVVKLKSFTEDEEQAIIDEFDDLDLDEL
jgi:hypothetical protein